MPDWLEDPSVHRPDSQRAALMFEGPIILMPLTEQVNPSSLHYAGTSRAYGPCDIGRECLGSEGR